MVTNINYKQFLEGGFFNMLEDEHINKALENIKGKYKLEGRALLIFLYNTGCRPIEALETRAKQITRDGEYLAFLLTTAKGGRARTLEFNLRKFPMMKELWLYKLLRYPEELLFPHFSNSYSREVTITRHTKKGDKTYIYPLVSKTDKLRYFFKVWFKDIFEGGVCPYYLRHNKMTKLAGNPKVSDRHLKQFKGSRTDSSIEPYIHLSKKTSRMLANIK